MPCRMFLITLLPKKCVMRQCVTTQQYFFLFLTVFLKKEMCIKAVEVDPWQLEVIPDHYKTQEACERAIEKDPYQLENIPDHFKTQLMCDDVVRCYLFSLQFVPDWFVTQEQ